MADIKNIVEEIKTLSVMELADLVHAIEEEFGVSAAAPVAVAAAPGAGAAAAEEKSEFDVILTDAGASKINVIKVVKEITGLDVPAMHAGITDEDDSRKIRSTVSERRDPRTDISSAQKKAVHVGGSTAAIQTDTQKDGDV